MSGERVLAALSPVVDLFDRMAIPYHIGGSVASSTFGEARSTLGVDLVAAVEQHHSKPITDALRDTYYVDEELITYAVQRRRSFNLFYLAQYFKVDVFVVQDTAYARESFARFTLAKLAGSGSARQFRFATPEDIVLNKLTWYRKGGEPSERQWLDLLSILRIRRGMLELDYLHRWAQDLRVDDLLARALATADSRWRRPDQACRVIHPWPVPRCPRQAGWRTRPSPPSRLRTTPMRHPDVPPGSCAVSGRS